MKGYGSQAAFRSATLIAEYDDDRHAKRDDEGPGAAEARDGVGDALAKGRFLFDHLVGIAHGTRARQFLGRVHLARHHRQNIQPRVRFPLDEHRDVMAVRLDANGLFERDGAGVMRRLFEHRGEAEEFAGHRLGDHHFLLIFIDGGDAHLARYQHVGAPAGVAQLIDALARREMLQVHLRGQHR